MLTGKNPYHQARSPDEIKKLQRSCPPIKLLEDFRPSVAVSVLGKHLLVRYDEFVCLFVVCCVCLFFFFLVDLSVYVCLFVCFFVWLNWLVFAWYSMISLSVCLSVCLFFCLFVLLNSLFWLAVRPDGLPTGTTLRLEHVPGPRVLQTQQHDAVTGLIPRGTRVREWVNFRSVVVV
jgi:hypothetical protein